jgi:hypothetical protein
MNLCSRIITSLFISAIAGLCVVADARAQTVRPKTFRDVVEQRMTTLGISFSDTCHVDTDPAARRIFSDYGAIYLSNADTLLPPRCIFGGESEVETFQRQVDAKTVMIGNTSVTLRASAMRALLAARAEALGFGLDITPRGGPTASRRTFGETVRLWNSRFFPALAHWVALGKISRRDADAAKTASIPEQVAKVLAWEDKGLFFSKDLSKSILYSVAAPGASQHIFLLALDVEQYSNAKVREIMTRHGWFQTVKSDVPHFTYLGVDEKELPRLGLRQVKIGAQIFWVPDISR